MPASLKRTEEILNLSSSPQFCSLRRYGSIWVAPNCTFGKSLSSVSHMALTSNQKRAQWRQKCREALARHIYHQLQLEVPPNKVRLQPSADDGYAWTVSESKRHLFDSHLSNGTVGLYQAICDEIGRSIEAVRPAALKDTQSKGDVVDALVPLLWSPGCEDEPM